MWEFFPTGIAVILIPINVHSHSFPFPSWSLIRIPEGFLFPLAISFSTADTPDMGARNSARWQNHMVTVLTSKNSKLGVAYPRFAVSKEHLCLM